MFLIVLTINYRGNKKYVLALIQCHDGIITNSINLFFILHSSLTCVRPNRFISLHNNTALKPEPHSSLFIASFLYYLFTREQVQSLYEQVILLDPDVARKQNTEQLLWKVCYYQVIEMLRRQESAEVPQATLNTYMQQLLSQVRTTQSGDVSSYSVR